MSSKKRILIIGAGASGLAGIKTCLEEGLEPVCFEQEDFIGGLWKFTPDERHSSVYRSTVINTSKEMMCFSDFPIPEKYPPFMHNTQIVEYFNLYAHHFGLSKYIHFKTTVLRVGKAPSYDADGKWFARFVKEGGQEEEAIFDGVLVCSGHHWKKRIPIFPGVETFKGQQMHSHSYKDASGFQGKKVLVIGIGNSGADLAVETSHCADHVYLSTRSGAWIFERLGESGQPGDTIFNTRLVSWIPLSIKNKIFETELIKKYGDLSNFGLTPNFPVFSAHPTINAELLGRIAVGKITAHPNVAKVTEKTVVFEDGQEVEVDVIIYATGYEITFPFLDESADVQINENHVNLYKFVYPPSHKHPTLAIIGLIQPWGAIMPISEMQIRWVTRIMNQKLALASNQEMKEDIEAKKVEMAQRYKKSSRHTIQVDYVNYMDELAKLLGVYPSPLLVAQKYPQLLKSILVGPCVPAQYRLFGPNPWPGAPKIISSTLARTNAAMTSKQTTHRKEKMTVSTSVADVIKGVGIIGSIQLISKL